MYWQYRTLVPAGRDCLVVSRAGLEAGYCAIGEAGVCVHQWRLDKNVIYVTFL
jgi:hypothetical protein